MSPPNEEMSSSASSLIIDSNKKQKVVVSSSSLAASTKSTTEQEQKATTTAAKTIITPDELEQLAIEMKERATKQIPFTTKEINDLITSIKHVVPQPKSNDDDKQQLDFDALTSLVKEVGHLSHKDWTKTIEYSSKLETILFPKRSTTSTADRSTNIISDIDDPVRGELFCNIFERVLRDGKWNTAKRYTSSEDNDDGKPWAVVVTGLNGIRKTTSIYQEFYKTLLNEAIVCPTKDREISSDLLPVGSNSFFRQLDHMIAVLANVQFITLYQIDIGNTDNISKEIVNAYSKYKDAIFSRYRTLSEMVGIILCKQAQVSRINVMVETSGRDISMYNYINSVFPTDKYNKLALHFTINDIKYAKTSVDLRMIDEIKRGKAALVSSQNDKESLADKVKRVVNVNAGGPYGSEVLDGVLNDSTRVWKEVWEQQKDKESSSSDSVKKVSDGWYKACFYIEGSEDKPWKVSSVLQDGDDKTNGSTFEFPPRK